MVEVNLKNPHHKKQVVWGFIREKGIAIFNDHKGFISVAYPDRVVKSPKAYTLEEIHRKKDELANHIYNKWKQ